MAAKAEKNFYGFFRQRQIGFREEPHPWTFEKGASTLIDYSIATSELKKTPNLDTDIFLMVMIRVSTIPEIRNHSKKDEMHRMCRTSAGFDNVPKYGWSGDTEFSLPATRVLTRAMEIAWYNNCEKIDEKHLLAGLMLEKEGAASRALDALGVDRKELILCPVPEKFRYSTEQIAVGTSW